MEKEYNSDKDRGWDKTFDLKTLLTLRPLQRPSYGRPHFPSSKTVFRDPPPQKQRTPTYGLQTGVDPQPMVKPL